MEWEEDAYDVEEGGGVVADKAFCLIFPAPHAPPGLLKGAAAKEHAQAERGLELGAKPALPGAGESEAARLARAAAFRACWGALDSSIQETLDRTDAGVFEELLAFAQHSHAAACQAAAAASAAPTSRAAWGRRLPTGLVLAGGVNGADHSTTFPNLAAFLKARGCYVAHLQAAAFGRVVSDTYGEALSQLSGGKGSAKADSLAAIVDWYRDEVGAAGLAAAAEEAADEEEGQEDDDMEEAEEEEEGSEEESDEEMEGKEEGRRLRQRPAGGAAAAAAAEELAAAQAANRARPLVVVVEGTESADILCLQAFVETFSERYHQLPITLVLGLTTTADALKAMVPSNVVDSCMSLRNFKLAPAMERLDGLVQQVLLGGNGRWPGLLFSRAIIADLTDTFFNHYYSTGIIRQGMMEAARVHFRVQPLSALAAAAVEGRGALEAAAAKLEPAVLKAARQRLGCRSAAQVADCVWEAMQGWSRWALGLQWLVAAAEAVGLRGQDFRPWKLLEEACVSDFAARQLAKLLARLEPLLRKLGPEAAAALAERLRGLAAAVWGGEEAAGELLQGMPALGEQEQQQQQQQEQEEASEGDAGSARDAAAGPSSAAAAAADGDGPPAKKKKKDRFHSHPSRQQALLQRAVENAAAKGKGGGASAAQRAQQAAAATPGGRLAAWLGAALRDLLAVHPTNLAKLPGAEVFTCRDVASLNCLTAEPRSDVHAALTEQHLFLPGLPADLGVSSGLEDACLTYRLLDQDPNCHNVADWYLSYVNVHVGASSAPGASSAAGEAGGKKAGKKAATKGGKGTKRKAAGEEGGEGGGAASLAASADVAVQRELAARFSQSTAELQYVGLIKPARRRRGDYVQRVAHMPAAGM